MPPAPSDVAVPPADAVRTESGIAMSVLQRGSEVDHPRGDDCVIVRYTAWKRDGSFFSTSGLHGETSTQCLAAAIPAIAEALRVMTPGEKRRVWAPAALTFVAREDSLPKADLTFDLELVRILRAAEKPDDLKTPPENALRTSSGLAILVLQAGQGREHPSNSSSVTLNYSGWTAAGKLIESTVTSGHAAVFLVGTTMAGWREALPQMVAGEKVRLWIPASLANGEHPPSTMTPAGDLVYDLELLSFR